MIVAKLVGDRESTPAACLSARQDYSAETFGADETGRIAWTDAVRLNQLQLVVSEKLVKVAATHVAKPPNLPEELRDTPSVAALLARAGGRTSAEVPHATYCSSYPASA
jgi:hypothetical protein